MLMETGYSLFKKGNEYFYEMDFDNAIFYYNEAIKNGVSRAYNQLGLIYLFASKYKNDSYAFYYFMQAYNMNKNDDRALFYLGFCYANSFGVKENKKEAFKFFWEAAKLNNQYAMYEVAKRLNIKKENPVAKRNLEAIIPDELKDLVNDSSKRQAKVFELTSQASATNLAAMFMLGGLYLSYKNDKNQAISWFTTAVYEFVERRNRFGATNNYIGVENHYLVEALKYLPESKDLTEMKNDDLAYIYFLQCEEEFNNERYEEAIKNCNEAINFSSIEQAKSQEISHRLASISFYLFFCYENGYREEQIMKQALVNLYKLIVPDLENLKDDFTKDLSYAMYLIVRWLKDEKSFPESLKQELGDENGKEKIIHSLLVAASKNLLIAKYMLADNKNHESLELLVKEYKAKEQAFSKAIGFDIIVEFDKWLIQIIKEDGFPTEIGEIDGYIKKLSQGKEAAKSDTTKQLASNSGKSIKLDVSDPFVFEKAARSYNETEQFNGKDFGNKRNKDGNARFESYIPKVEEVVSNEFDKNVEKALTNTDDKIHEIPIEKIVTPDKTEKIKAANENEVKNLADKPTEKNTEQHPSTNTKDETTSLNLKKDDQQRPDNQQKETKNDDRDNKINPQPKNTIENVSASGGLRQIDFNKLLEAEQQKEKATKNKNVADKEIDTKKREENKNQSGREKAKVEGNKNNMQQGPQKTTANRADKSVTKVTVQDKKAESKNSQGPKNLIKPESKKDVEKNDSKAPVIKPKDNDKKDNENKVISGTNTKRNEEIKKPIPKKEDNSSETKQMKPVQSKEAEELEAVIAILKSNEAPLSEFLIGILSTTDKKITLIDELDPKDESVKFIFDKLPKNNHYAKAIACVLKVCSNSEDVNRDKINDVFGLLKLMPFTVKAFEFLYEQNRTSVVKAIMSKQIIFIGNDFQAATITFDEFSKKFIAEDKLSLILPKKFNLQEHNEVLLHSFEQRKLNTIQFLKNKFSQDFAWTVYENKDTQEQIINCLAGCDKEFIEKLVNSNVIDLRHKYGRNSKSCYGEILLKCIIEAVANAENQNQNLDLAVYLANEKGIKLKSNQLLKLYQSLPDEYKNQIDIFIKDVGDFLKDALKNFCEDKLNEVELGGILMCSKRYFWESQGSVHEIVQSIIPDGELKKEKDIIKLLMEKIFENMIDYGSECIMAFLDKRLKVDDSLIKMYAECFAHLIYESEDEDKKLERIESYIGESKWSDKLRIEIVNVLRMMWATQMNKIIDQKKEEVKISNEDEEKKRSRAIGFLKDIFELMSKDDCKIIVLPKISEESLLYECRDYVDGLSILAQGDNKIDINNLLGTSANMKTLFDLCFDPSSVNYDDILDLVLFCRLLPNPVAIFEHLSENKARNLFNGFTKFYLSDDMEYKHEFISDRNQFFEMFIDEDKLDLFLGKTEMTCSQDEITRYFVYSAKNKKKNSLIYLFEHFRNWCEESLSENKDLTDDDKKFISECLGENVISKKEEIDESTDLENYIAKVKEYSNRDNNVSELIKRFEEEVWNEQTDWKEYVRGIIAIFISNKESNDCKETVFNYLVKLIGDKVPFIELDDYNYEILSGKFSGCIKGDIAEELFDLIDEALFEKRNIDLIAVKLLLNGDSNEYKFLIQWIDLLLKQSSYTAILDICTNDDSKDKIINILSEIKDNDLAMYLAEILKICFKKEKGNISIFDCVRHLRLLPPNVVKIFEAGNEKFRKNIVSHALKKNIYVHAYFALKELNQWAQEQGKDFYSFCKFFVHEGRLDLVMDNLPENIDQKRLTNEICKLMVYSIDFEKDEFIEAKLASLKYLAVKFHDACMKAVYQAEDSDILIKYLANFGTKNIINTIFSKGFDEKCLLKSLQMKDFNLAQRILSVDNCELTSSTLTYIDKSCPQDVFNLIIEKINEVNVLAAAVAFSKFLKGNICKEWLCSILKKCLEKQDGYTDTKDIMKLVYKTCKQQLNDDDYNRILSIWNKVYVDVYGIEDKLDYKLPILDGIFSAAIELNYIKFDGKKINGVDEKAKQWIKPIDPQEFEQLKPYLDGRNEITKSSLVNMFNCFMQGKFKGVSLNFLLKLYFKGKNEVFNDVLYITRAIAWRSIDKNIFNIMFWPWNDVFSSDKKKIIDCTIAIFICCIEEKDKITFGFDSRCIDNVVSCLDKNMSVDQFKEYVQSQTYYTECDDNYKRSLDVFLKMVGLFANAISRRAIAKDESVLAKAQIAKEREKKRNEENQNKQVPAVKKKISGYEIG